MIQECPTCATPWESLSPLAGLVTTRYCPKCTALVVLVEDCREEHELRTQGLRVVRSAAFARRESGWRWAHVGPRLEPVIELPISIVAAQALKDGGVFYVGDLIHRTESELVGLGVPSVCVQEIKSALATRGLTIGNRIEDWPPAAKG